MKWVFITGFFGLLGLTAIGYGAWHWYHDAPVDTTQSGFVDSYEKSFAASCASGAETSAANAGRKLDDAMRTRIRQVCACGAEASADEFKSKEHMTMSEMLSDPMLKQKLPAIMQTCVQKFGAQ
jgi:hypothetical protein